MVFGKVESSFRPLPTACFEGTTATKIRQLACGATHALFISEQGEAFAVGKGTHGKLGLGVLALKRFRPRK